MDSHHRQEVVDLFSDNTESLEIESVGLFLGKEGVKRFFLDNDLDPENRGIVESWINIRIFMNGGVINIDPSGTSAKGTGSASGW